MSLTIWLYDRADRLDRLKLSKQQVGENVMYQRNLWLCILVACLLSPCVWPQASTGTASGTVRDQTGAFVPNATVTLTAVNANAVSTTKTNGAGFYIFPGLVPGPYRLAAESSGMARFEASLTVDATLSAVGDITDRKRKRLNSSHLGISYSLFC